MTRTGSASVSIRLSGADFGSLAAVGPVFAVPTWTLSNHDIEREVTRYDGGAVGVARAQAMILLELTLPRLGVRIADRYKCVAERAPLAVAATIARCRCRDSMTIEGIVLQGYKHHDTRAYLFSGLGCAGHI
ncbi:hypothetical protein [Nocardia gipuzkoensis]|uniref:hypothetical protein n=1 Tax=Nocardia gipuzkoensis TaxID=2749991 RepID=UPI003EDFB5C3